MIVDHHLHSGDSMVRSLGMCEEVIRVTGDGIGRSLGSLGMVLGGLWGCVEVIRVTGDGIGRSFGSPGMVLGGHKVHWGWYGEVNLYYISL